MPVAICSNKPRPSLQNNHSKGSQHWRRDVWHIQGDAGKTLCGRDATGWLTIGNIALDLNVCGSCEKKHSQPSLEL